MKKYPHNKENKLNFKLSVLMLFFECLLNSLHLVISGLKYGMFGEQLNFHYNWKSLLNSPLTLAGDFTLSSLSLVSIDFLG